MYIYLFFTSHKKNGIKKNHVTLISTDGVIAYTAVQANFGLRINI